MYSFKHFITEIFDKPPRVEYDPNKSFKKLSGAESHTYYIHHDDKNVPPATASLIHNNDSKSAELMFSTVDPRYGHSSLHRNPSIGPSQSRKIFAGVHEVIKQHIQSGRMGDIRRLGFEADSSDHQRVSLYKRFTKKYGGKYTPTTDGVHDFSIPIANIKKHLGVE